MKRISRVPASSLFRLNNARRGAIAGLLFVLPFYVGFLVFFLKPLLESILFVFSDVKVEIGGYHTTFTGLQNLRTIFLEDPDFGMNLTESLVQLLWQLPAIIIASLIIAVMLNSRFRGRTFTRMVFFLPVVMASGLVFRVIDLDVAASNVMTGNVVANGSISYNDSFSEMLVQSGLNSELVSFFVGISNNVFDMLRKTGVQMIIFLAGLQGIPTSLYEASTVEGATAWESFWKITVPMILPIMLLNVVYTVVDAFTDSNNPVMVQMITNANQMRHGWAAAMSWSYFAIVGVLLAIIMFVFSRLKASK